MRGIIGLSFGSEGSEGCLALFLLSLRDLMFGMEALEWRWRLATGQVVSFRDTQKLDMGVAL